MESNEDKMKRFETFVKDKMEELNNFICLNEFTNHELKRLEQKTINLEKELKDTEKKKSEN